MQKVQFMTLSSRVHVRLVRHEQLTYHGNEAEKILWMSQWMILIESLKDTLI